jgi:hypothetical protein
MDSIIQAIIRVGDQELLVFVLVVVTVARKVRIFASNSVFTEAGTLAAKCISIKECGSDWMRCYIWWSIKYGEACSACEVCACTSVVSSIMKVDVCF